MVRSQNIWRNVSCLPVVTMVSCIDTCLHSNIWQMHGGYDEQSRQELRQRWYIQILNPILGKWLFQVAGMGYSGSHFWDTRLPNEVMIVHLMVTSLFWHKTHITVDRFHVMNIDIKRSSTGGICKLNHFHRFTDFSFRRECFDCLV